MMKAIDLFAGCGGLSLGLGKANINVIAAYEKWIPAIEIYKKNFHHPIHEFDLSDVNDAVRHINQYSPDIIVGGPPCQDFSSAGKREEKGDRADLTMSFANIIVAVKPNWFLMENVERINKSDIFKQIRKLLSVANYGLTQIVLDASFCNVPQKRKRMFLIGKINEPDDFLEPILKAGLSKRSMTIRDYLDDELDVEFYYRHARSYSRRGIFSIDEPSPTIRGVNRPIPPNYKIHEGDASKEINKLRPLSPIERSYLQTFPKDFKWVVKNKSTLEQIIGNAVPVNLAKFVGEAILSYQNKNVPQSLQYELV